MSVLFLIGKGWTEGSEDDFKQLLLTSWDWARMTAVKFARGRYWRAMPHKDGPKWVSIYGNLEHKVF